jgi:hypothetical protein
MNKVLSGIMLLGFSAALTWAWRVYYAQRLQHGQAARDIERWEDEGGQDAARRRPASAETDSYLV